MRILRGLRAGSRTDRHCSEKHTSRQGLTWAHSYYRESLARFCCHRTCFTFLYTTNAAEAVRLGRVSAAARADAGPLPVCLVSVITIRLARNCTVATS